MSDPQTMRCPACGASARETERKGEAQCTRRWNCWKGNVAVAVETAKLLEDMDKKKVARP